MQLGAQSVFVGSGIFKSSDPAKRARAIVEATTHYTDADIVAKVSRGLGEAMRGEEIEHARREARRPRLVSDRAVQSRGLQAIMKIGVLALQGAFREHAEAFDALGADVVARQARPSISRASTRSSCPAGSRPRSTSCSTRRAAHAAARRAP